MNIKGLFCKIKYELAVFAVLTAQTALLINWRHPVDTDFLSFYLLDFKVGFVSRALIGSFINLLAGNVTQKWLTGFVLLSLVFVYFVLALILGRLIRRAQGEIRSAVIFLVSLFLLTGYTGAVFADNIGLLDIYWFLFALLAMVFLKNRLIKWLIPALCFMGLATHYGFAMTFLPFVFVLLFYEIAAAKRKKGPVLLAAASFAVSAVSSVYFVFFANSHLKMDSEGVFQYLSAKTDFPVWRFYFDGYLFYTNLYSGENAGGFSGLMAVLKDTASEGARAANYISAFLLALPLLLLFFFLWKTAFKMSSDKAEKGVFLLCMALPLPVLPSFVFSTDFERFLGEILIVQFLALFYMLAGKNSAVVQSVKKAEFFFRKHPVLLVLLIVFSLSVFFIK